MCTLLCWYALTMPDSHLVFEAFEMSLESKVIFVILLHTEFGLWLARTNMVGFSP